MITSSPQHSENFKRSPQKTKNYLRIALFWLLLPIGTVLLLFGAVECAGLYIGNKRAHDVSLAVVTSPVPDSGSAKKEDAASLQKKLAALTPRGMYVVIDTGRNLLYMKNGDEELHKAIISTGSGKTLQDPNSAKKWVFDTPRGVHTIKTKVKNPLWVKPDWAFIEENEALPKKFNDRVEEGMMGDYALGIGNGYFLHGTMYSRMLGKSVSHGCVRIGDADLEKLYKEAPVGTKVYIF
ncbi:MAG: hypothetical protein A2511_11600 [Deltaproteobacteria bacterium RIFOXYD12_FULL_50_9]|nr:MAG: hypothetical protein A2511_11600 [Deltaproteobacteria bacterium RIFOXYD12_FULL_50_9]